MSLILPYRVKLKYEIETLVSEDLLAYRYEGVRLDTKAPIWIWEFKPEWLNGDLIQSLINSSDLLIQHSYEGVLSLQDYDYDGEVFLVITEALQGADSLDVFFKERGDLQLNQLWNWSMSLFSTLSYLEEHRLYHGALSSRMIWVTSEGNLKVAMPQLYAIILQSLFTRVDVIDELIFLAPEMVQFQCVDSRSDMYSMGILMYLFFTRRWPYPYTDFVQEHKRHLLKAPRSYRPFSDKLPEKLGVLIQRCLMKDAGNRFSSFSALVVSYKTNISLDIETSREMIVDKAIRKDLQEKRQSFWFKWVLYAGIFIILSGLVWGGFQIQRSFFNRIPDKRVPDVVGLELEKATSILRDFGLESQVAGERFHTVLPEGSIVSTKPPPGRDVKANRMVRLFISKGIPQVLVTDFVGRSLESVQQFANDRHHGIEVIGEVFSDLYQKGVVIRQSPSPNTFLMVSQNVQVEVSKGYPVSFSLAEAESWFFVKNDDLRRITITFQVLDSWPDQDVKIVFRYKEQEEILYHQRKLSGEQDTLVFELNLKGVIELYFNDELASTFVVQDEEQENDE